MTNGGNYGGNISGTGGVNLQGGTLILSTGGSTYSGATVVSGGGTLEAGAASALSPNSPISLQGSFAALDIAFDNSTPSLDGDFGTTVTIGNGATLSITDADGETYAGIIGGGGSLTLASGSGEWNLSGSNTYGGANNHRIWSDAAITRYWRHPKFKFC